MHALLGIETMEDLFAHPVYGASFEGYVIENIIAGLPRWEASFYRTSNGAEIDLLLTKGTKIVAVEIKASTSPKLSRRFWNSIEAIAPDRTAVIALVEEPYPLAPNATVMPLGAFHDWL